MATPIGGDNELAGLLEALVRDTNQSVSFQFSDGSFVVTFGNQQAKAGSLPEALKILVGDLAERGGNVLRNPINLGQQLPAAIGNSINIDSLPQLPDFSGKPWYVNPKQYLMFLYEGGKIDFNFKETRFDAESSNGDFIAYVELTNGRVLEGRATAKRESEKQALFSLLSSLEESLGSDFSVERAKPAKKLLIESFEPIVSKTPQAKLILAYYLNLPGMAEGPKVHMQFNYQQWIAKIEFVSRINGNEKKMIEAVANTKIKAYNALLDMLYQLVMQETANTLVNEPTEQIDNFAVVKSTATLQFELNMSDSLFDLLNAFIRNSSQYMKYFPSECSYPMAEEELNFIRPSKSDDEKALDTKSRALRKEAKFSYPNYPIKRYQNEILEAIDQNQVVIIKGSAGCGKTTQVPSYLLHQYSAHGIGATCNVIVSEPRKIAARNAAYRVAQEWNEPLGRKVGYNVRFDKQLPERNGSITYCTNGVLLRMLTNPSRLRNYFSHIILDEVHERSVEIDLLLLAIKTLLRENENLKVVLMSGTIDTQIFVDYFSVFQPVVLTIEQEIFPVQCSNLEHFPSLPSDYTKFSDQYSKDFIKEELLDLNAVEFKPVNIPYDVITYVLERVIRNPKITGDILIFLPGWEHIQTLFKTLESIYTSKQIQILAMHSMISQEQHDLVFAKSNKRRIILSTNIAESSITIESVNVVIDSLKEKKPLYDHDTKIHSFKLDWISQASMNQRKGRAGRTGNGYYYALAAPARIDRLEPYSKPEMQTLDLYQICLQVKSISHSWSGIGTKIEEILADTISPPSTSIITQSIERLTVLGALDADEEHLTYLGQLLAKLPLDPELGKMLLLSCLFKCLDPILTVVAVLSTDSSLYIRKPLSTIRQPVREPEDYRLKWAGNSENSDLIAIIHTFNEWYSIRMNHSAEEEVEYCTRFGISCAIIQKVYDTKTQLASILQEEFFSCSPNQPGTSEAELNVNSSNMALVKGILMDTFCDNLFIRANSKSVAGTIPYSAMSALIHPSSIHATRCNYVENSVEFVASMAGKLKHMPYFYERSQRGTQLYLFNLCRCTYEQLLFFSNLEAIPSGTLDGCILTCRNLFSLGGTNQHVNCILGLRRIFEAICDDFYKTISLPQVEQPGNRWSISSIKQALVNEFVVVFSKFMEE